VGKQEKNEVNLSDTMEINVEMARKAVGSLFAENDDVPADKQEVKTERKAQDDEQDSKRSKWEAFIKENPDLDDDDGPIFPKSFSRTMPIPAPKPAVKVNASIPAASRIPARSERRQATDVIEPIDLKAGDKISLVPPKEANREPQPKKKFVFVDDDEKKKAEADEFASFRQRYSERDAKAPYFQEEGPVKADKYASTDGGAYVESGISAFMRGIITAFMVMLLVMMAFLVHRNIVLGGRLDDAIEQLAGIPELQNDLTRARIDLELAGENTSALEAEIMRLEGIIAHGGLATTPVEGEGIEGTDGGEYTEEVHTNETDVSATADTPDAPAAPAAQRIHVVAPGDILSRIAHQYFGSSSPENVRRIMDANNMTTYDIFVGDELIIPN